MEIENDQVVKKDYLDLLDISVEVGEKEDNKFFSMVSQLTVIFRSSFSSMSVEHSSRPSTTGTSTSGYDGSSRERTNDGKDPGKDGRDLRQQ
ncbi:hypothetical protein AAG906_039044 [Vitis piasezkii]